MGLSANVSMRAYTDVYCMSLLSYKNTFFTKYK